MIVKVCGITNPEDALAAAGGGATAVGFIFYPKSLRYITAEAAARISAILPADVWRVGLFVNTPPEEIARVQKLAGLNVAQLQGDEPPDALPSGIRVWKTLHVDNAFGPSKMEPYDVEAFLLDTPTAAYGGSGRTFDWSKARNTGRRVILAGGLDDTNVQDAIRSVQPWGVDACSRLESAPGRKDHQRMARFLKAALAETER